MSSLATNTASGTDWVTFVGAVGIGAIVGAAVTGLVTALNGKWQRDHDREMRVKDYEQQTIAREATHRQELALKQLEEMQRLRDRRLLELKAGLTEMVESFVALTEEMQEVRLGPANKQKASAAHEEAVKHFQLGRTLLVLDPVGRELMQKFREINTEIILYATMLEGQRVLVEAHQRGAIEHSEEMGRQEKKVFKLASDAVDRAQQIMEEAAQPVTA